VQIIANKTAENDASRARIRAWKNGTFGINTSGAGMGSPAPNQQTKTGLKAWGDSKESGMFADFMGGANEHIELNSPLHQLVYSTKAPKASKVAQA